MSKKILFTGRVSRINKPSNSPALTRIGASAQAQAQAAATTACDADSDSVPFFLDVHASGERSNKHQNKK
jgi:hypothetical protein